MIPGQKLREAREKAGVSQAEIARRLGVTQSYVSTVETGQKLPSLSWSLGYLKALGPGKASIFVAIRGFLGDECVIEAGEVVE